MHFVNKLSLKLGNKNIPCNQNTIIANQSQGLVYHDIETTQLRTFPLISPNLMYLHLLLPGLLKQLLLLTQQFFLGNPQPVQLTLATLAMFL